ncbi:MAG: hypothetical protein ACI39Q_05845 [Wujia sp.]
MYYVPDGTQRCGYYECTACGSRFLAMETTETTVCPYCDSDIDLEIGPDEDMQSLQDTARLQQILVGEDVEKMDMLLSLAITGGNYEWI